MEHLGQRQIQKNNLQFELRVFPLLVNTKKILYHIDIYFYYVHAPICLVTAILYSIPIFIFHHGKLPFKTVRTAFVSVQFFFQFVCSTSTGYALTEGFNCQAFSTIEILWEKKQQQQKTHVHVTVSQQIPE